MDKHSRERCSTHVRHIATLFVHAFVCSCFMCFPEYKRGIPRIVWGGHNNLANPLFLDYMEVSSKMWVAYGSLKSSSHESILVLKPMTWGSPIFRNLMWVSQIWSSEESSQQPIAPGLHFERYGLSGLCRSVRTGCWMFNRYHTKIGLV